MQAVQASRGAYAQGALKVKGWSAEATDVKHDNYILMALTLDSSIGLFVSFDERCDVKWSLDWKLDIRRQMGQVIQ